MPRQPRLDIPGVLQHVIVRGIDGTDIFRDDEDREHFAKRLSTLLVDTGTDCYAWALIPNHFHLLLCCNDIALSSFMRRLLTGHAVNFNRRHTRSGHLFQNRYKSIVCEEETYFMELVRYIHLNPLRAGLVKQLDELDQFPWCGHSVLLGSQILSGQTVDPVLERFGKRLKTARRNYRQFIVDGLAMGKRPDLVGGGLRRSQVSAGPSQGDEDYDDRVLGGGDFVAALRQESDLLAERPLGLDLDKLQQLVISLFDLTSDQFKRRGRQNDISVARSLFSYIAVIKLQKTGVDVGKFLGLDASSVSRAVRRGEELYHSQDNLRKWWDKLLTH